MKTPNYKKAIKNLVKMSGEHSLVFYNLNNYNTVVSDGCCLITIPKADFDEIRADLGKVGFFESEKLFNAFSKWDNSQGQLAEETPLLIDVASDKQVRVFKLNNELLAINQKYIDIIKNTINPEDFHLYGTGPKSPLYNVNRGKHVIGVLPIYQSQLMNTDVTIIINKVLE